MDSFMITIQVYCITSLMYFGLGALGKQLPFMDSWNGKHNIAVNNLRPEVV